MAVTDLHHLSEIDDSSERWIVKVRVSRKWNVVDFASQENTLRVDMLLLDENNDQIHATIPKRQLKYSALLQEGGVYFLHNFSVGITKGLYRPVQHQYRIFIKWDTRVKPVSDIRPTFPRYKFGFVDYDNLKLRQGDNTYLTDVYGKLESVSNVMTVETGTLREIYLKDRSGTDLKVTLWGNAIHQLPHDIVDVSATCPVVVVTSSTVKLFEGVYSLSSTTATKIYVNLDIPEVAHFKEIEGNEANTVKLIAPSSTAITLEERMVTKRKTLVEIVQAIRNASIGEKFTCRAVISEVIYDFEPFYFSCTDKDCRKKVFQRGSKYWCDNCSNFVDYPVARYKIHVEIQDHTRSASISIFDREVQRLLKRPVAEMVDLNAMDDGSDSVKDILDELVGLEFVFEIKVSEYNIRDESGVPSFTASKVMVVDEEIETKHFPQPIEGDRKMKRVVEDSTTYASSSRTITAPLQVYDKMRGLKKLKMIDAGNKGSESGTSTANIFEETNVMEVYSSPIEVISENMDDSSSSSTIVKGKRGRRKLISSL